MTTLEQVLTAYPTLCAEGFRSPNWREQGRPDLRDRPDEIATALAFLGACRPARFQGWTHSYILKHVAERWGRVWGYPDSVSNGALIAAALMAGYRIRRLPTVNTLNAMVAVTKESVRLADPHDRHGQLKSGRWRQVTP